MIAKKNINSGKNVNIHFFKNGSRYSYTANRLDAEAIENFLSLPEVENILSGYWEDEEPYDEYHALAVFADCLQADIEEQFSSSSLASRVEELVSLIEDSSPFFTIKEIIDIALELASDFDDFDLEDELEFQPGLEGWDLCLSPALR